MLIITFLYEYTVKIWLINGLVGEYKVLISENFKLIVDESDLIVLYCETTDGT